MFEARALRNMKVQNTENEKYKNTSGIWWALSTRERGL